jgi:predicted HNH restriction endonuclease
MARLKAACYVSSSSYDCDVAPSDIHEPDIVAAIAEYDKLGSKTFLEKYQFGKSEEYRLVYGGKFYESKAIVGVAHGFATGEFWTAKRPFGGVGPGNAVTILEELGFLVDRGELHELTELRVDRSHGTSSPYQYVVLLWAMARARAAKPRLTAFSDSKSELAELLAPFAIGRFFPNPAMPWFTLRGCSWWESDLPEERAGMTYNDIPTLNPLAGLASDRYDRIAEDEKYAAAALDVIFHLIGAEPGYKPMLERLGMAELLTATPRSSKALRVNWSWDELVIACDMIASNNWESIQKKDLRIAALSEFLRRQPEAIESDDFRSPGSVYFKLENIRSAHPDYTKKPTKGGKTTQLVVNAFVNNPDAMHRAAQALWRNGDLARSHADWEEEVADEPETDTASDYASAVEGRVIQRLVRVAERNPKLRRAKIAASRKERGSIACEICGFDFESVYGTLGDGFIHVHHRVPLHFTGVVENKLEDLILVCANCHVMIHRGSPWKTPEELRRIIES